MEVPSLTVDASPRNPESRRVVALEIPDFAVAVERLRWPPLRGRPVAIAQARSPRAALLSVSLEARAAGLVPGLPVSVARALCPETEFLPPDVPTYRAVVEEIARALSGVSPVVEPSLGGRFFVDAAAALGRGARFGDVDSLALRARRRVEEHVGLTGPVGVATNKLVSGIAAEEAGNRDPLRDVRPGDEARFLAPLPALRLPGIGDRTERLLLAELNVRLVGQLAVVRVAALARLFGSGARLLHERALGIDPTPVRPAAGEGEIAESSILPADSNDDRLLRSTVTRLATDASFRLRATGFAASRLALTLRHTDDVESRGSAILRHPCAEQTPIEMAALGLLASAGARRVRVRAVTLSLSRLVPAPRQLDLFSPAAAARAARLATAVDRLRARFGGEAIRYGRAL